MKLFDPPRLTGKYLAPVLESGWLTAGLRCQELQEAVAGFLDCRPECVVLGSSATAGWQGIFDLLRPRSVVISPATFVGMLQVVELGPAFAGASAPVVHVRTSIGGDLCDDTNWIEGAVRVRDACHSWLLDETADFTMFSFYPTKLVPGAEGGAVACWDSRDAEQLRLHLYCGMVPGQAGSGRPPVLCGRRAIMTDVAAALNLEALELAPRYIADLAYSWAQLADCARARGLPFRPQPVRPYLFQVELPAAQIQPAMAALKELGIPSAWQFPPAGLLTLPCFPHMTLTEADRVIDAVSKVVPSR